MAIWGYKPGGIARVFDGDLVPEGWSNIPYEEMTAQEATASDQKFKASSDEDIAIAVSDAGSIKDKLLAQGAALGVKTDGRWSVARLQEAVTSAKADAAVVAFAASTDPV